MLVMEKDNLAILVIRRGFNALNLFPLKSIAGLV